MGIYSFRAECQTDVEGFRQALNAAEISHSIDCRPDSQFPDVDVELKTDATLEILKTLLRTVPDGHVMVETLRAGPLAENSLERSQI